MSLFNAALQPSEWRYILLQTLPISSAPVMTNFTNTSFVKINSEMMGHAVAL
jgi:hypothetical protein